MSVNQPSSSNPRSKLQWWLSGSALVVVVGIVASILVVRHNSDLLRPLIEAGVPLASASDWPVVGYAIKEAETPVMSVQQLKQLIDSKAINNYVLVDVRTPDEYKLSHIPGSVLVPLTEIDQGKGIDQIKSTLKGRKLLAYCTSGKRSARALVLLEKAGIKGIKVQGGIKDWTQEIDPSLPRNNW